MKIYLVGSSNISPTSETLVSLTSAVNLPCISALSPTATKPFVKVQ